MVYIADYYSIKFKKQKNKKYIIYNIIIYVCVLNNDSWIKNKKLYTLEQQLTVYAFDHGIKVKIFYIHFPSIKLSYYIMYLYLSYRRYNHYWTYLMMGIVHIKLLNQLMCMSKLVRLTHI